MFNLHNQEVIVARPLEVLIGAGSYDKLRSSHKGWIEEYLEDEAKNRQDEWTGSIAVGSRPFIEEVKALLGFKAKERAVIEGNEGYQLREESAHYKALFGAEKDDIGLENTYFWDVKSE